MFNALQFLEDHTIPHHTSGKNVPKGGVNVNCPFCDDPSAHLTLPLKKDYGGNGKCWRCGRHWIPHIIAALLSLPLSEAVTLFKRYSVLTTHLDESPPAAIKRNLHVTLPSGCQPLLPRHSQYLISRHFDPQRLVSEWGLLSTGPTGRYRHRILAPIIFQGQMVSYQCRAISSEQSVPYLPCEAEQEVIPYKTTVYGFDRATERGQCIIVEGITDVWRLGTGSVALFGKKYTKHQLLLIASSFPRAWVMLDADVNSQEADQITGDLKLLGCKAEAIPMSSGDPGELSQATADAIMKDLGF